MTISRRILREQTESFRNMPRFPYTAKEVARHELILEAGLAYLARHGFGQLRLPDMADALRMSAFTFRKHFIDLETLLATLILNHLRAVATAIGTVANNDPDCIKKRRVAYLAATRGAFGAMNPGHLITTRDRHSLPPELRTQVDDIRAFLAGRLLAAPTEYHAGETLTLFDSAEMEPDRIRQVFLLVEAGPRYPEPEKYVMPPQPPPEIKEPNTEFVPEPGWDRNLPPLPQSRAEARAESRAKAGIDPEAEPDPDQILGALSDEQLWEIVSAHAPPNAA